MAKAKKQEAEAAPEGEGAEALPKKKMGLVKKLLFFGLPLLLVVGGVYFFFFMGGETPKEGEAGAQHAEAEPPTFVDIEPILVDLVGPGGERPKLKLTVALEVEDPEVAAAIQPVMPRVIDNFQVFLRELRVEDLGGSAGMFRLKEELVRRVNLAVAPSHVKDVLFKEMLIQ